jgi:hypothetical protein
LQIGPIGLVMMWKGECAIGTSARTDHTRLCPVSAARRPGKILDNPILR